MTALQADSFEPRRDALLSTKPIRALARSSSPRHLLLSVTLRIEVPPQMPRRTSASKLFKKMVRRASVLDPLAILGRLLWDTARPAGSGTVGTEWNKSEHSKGDPTRRTEGRRRNKMQQIATLKKDS